MWDFPLLCKSAPQCTDVPLCAHFCAIFSWDYLMSILCCKRCRDILNSRHVLNVAASSEQVLADVHQLWLCLWLCSCFDSHIFVNSMLDMSWVDEKLVYSTENAKQEQKKKTHQNTLTMTLVMFSLGCHVIKMIPQLYTLLPLPALRPPS